MNAFDLFTIYNHKQLNWKTEINFASCNAKAGTSRHRSEHHNNYAISGKKYNVRSKNVFIKNPTSNVEIIARKSFVVVYVFVFMGF